MIHQYNTGCMCIKISIVLLKRNTQLTDVKTKFYFGITTVSTQRTIKMLYAVLTAVSLSVVEELYSAKNLTCDTICSKFTALSLKN